MSVDERKKSWGEKSIEIEFYKPFKTKLNFEFNKGKKKLRKKQRLLN